MKAKRETDFRRNLIDLVRARNPVLLVESHEDSRVLEIIMSVARDPGIKRPRNVAAFTLSRGLHVPGETGKAVAPVDALAAVMKIPDPTIFVFYDLQHFLGGQGRAPEPAVVRGLQDVAREFRTGQVPHTLVIVGPSLTLPVELEKEVSVVDLPLPGRVEIASVLDDIISANASQIEVDLSEDDRQRLLQAAQGLTLREAENAFARAIASDRRLDAADIEMVLEEKRQTIKKSGLLEFIDDVGSIDDIGGLENLKTWLNKRNGSWLPSAQEWSIPAPKGVLITGVPGCGKSLTAKCMSSLWGLPLLRMDVGRVFSGLVGSSEQNMRASLRLAEAVAPSILWIDEIEKGFGAASGGDSGTSQRVFGTFLTWLQEKSQPVFVIATANKIDGLPPELLRKGRFDEIFFVDLPTTTELKVIWKIQLQQRLTPGSKASGEIEVSNALLEQLAEESNGFSGAEVAEAVVSACFDAYSERRALRDTDLIRTIKNTVPLSTTQAEQIRAIRQWASQRAVAATSAQDQFEYDIPVPADTGDVASWRGGRRIDF